MSAIFVGVAMLTTYDYFFTPTFAIVVGYYNRCTRILGFGIVVSEVALYLSIGEL
jgi:hypothetical protein